VEYPQYTRPADYRGLTVPDVLLSGHHEQIRQWRLDAARARTRERDAGAASSEGDGDSSG
jgi:tRNA (guanine37-N1)-methyltransferase